MASIYSVDYEERYKGLREWISDRDDVLSNNGAESAVKKVKRLALRRSFEDMTKRGKVVVRKCVGFRLVAVEKLASTTLD